MFPLHALMDPARSAAQDRVRLSELEEKTRPTELGIEREKTPALDQHAYPVLTLPNEIVAEIFTQYLPPYPDFPPLVGPGSPTYLLGICRLWRSIALHSPELWRAIKLRCKVHPNWVGLAEAWLQRSGARPLSLHLDFGHSSQIRTKGNDSLLQAVIAQRSRWEYIHINAPPSQITLISRGSAPASGLVRLHLSTRWPLTSDRGISFHHAPRLRSVCLWNIGYNLSSLPWGQLTSLALLNTCISLVDCASILQTATNLVRCKLHTEGGIEDLRAAPFRLPQLEILVLHGLFNRDEDDYLAAFTLPSLRKLEISECFLGPHAIERIQSLFSRSACRLAHLRIVCDLSQATEWIAPSRIAFPDVAVDACAHNYLSDGGWETEEYWDKDS
ncbi:hypothetical protein C8F01DRAFT_4118 [Mycena amicta]|nr:hypothetical protein C8F01DRAFT_4118 [Mycena amicta]